ncbi:hypothetical protein CUMW_192050 [Citrus unshiu]|uniref:CTLH domain-containing protein n=1 Tax=Citrus unshiu TaxID=55188 RepID=A0A2H5Q386_CITUN|nr:hypothetical protein CUMW_192050 [Citrus unshiu]GAY59109.1 hypothetical protein CUMW_192050 [Citrus unshiu]
MSSLSRELVFLILQFLDEEKFKETVHKLEQESGFFFNMKYFEDEVHNGNWDDVEKYLSGFTKVDDNRYSMKIFFEIRKQKYLEALDKHDRAKAVEILVKDLKVFSTFNEELFKEITQLLTLENFRENEQLSKYGDTKSARSIMLVELKKLIEANPLFRDKLQFPNLKNSRLRTLINQSLNWQHQLCKNPRPNPDIKTLFVDHTCGQPNGARAPSPANNPLLGSLPKAGVFPPLGAHGPFQPTPAPVPTPLAGWMSNPPTCNSSSSFWRRLLVLGVHPSQLHPRTPPTNPSVDYPSGGFLTIFPKGLGQIGISDEINLPVNVLPVSFTGHSQVTVTAFSAPEDLPKTVTRTFESGSSYEHDFHLFNDTSFSCLFLAKFKDGESFIVEWNESEGAVKRTYQGFRKRSLGVVQFDTTKNRFLAAGDDFSIKFWDMDNVQLLTSIDADGGLPASPRIRFNKDGCLLAVSTNDNGIKILATSDGIRLLRTFENLSYDASRTSENSKPTISPISAAAAAAATSAGLADRAASMVSIPGMNGDVRSLADVKPRITEESNDKSKVWKLTELSEPNQCRSLRLPENLRATKISRLIFTNSGNAILALASNAIHLLWKWQRTERNSSGKATASVAPQLWQPPSGIMMTNDVTDSNPEEAVPCFALSKNDSYVMSASGGKISLFNMMTFKTMATFMPPPPAATFLAFHPQDNNIIAIGMDDSSIQIYNVRVDEVKSKLKGHSKRITGLAFSHALNVLVSSGADSQLCVWGSDGWEKQKNRFLQIPTGRTPTAQSDTRVQFHQDQIHFLVVHETQLAIFETTKLECVKQWVPRESSAPITHATFSCDSQLVYACFLDATVCVFSAANLKLRCRINPSAYLPAGVSSSNVHPLVIAAHPHEPNEFALGLSDGGVHVFEPLESEGKWGVPPPVDNGSTSSMPATPPVGGSGSDQAQR